MPSTALIFSKSARPRVNPLRRARGFRILRMSNHLPHIVPFGSNLSRIVRLRDRGTAAAPDCEDAIRATSPVWRDHGCQQESMLDPVSTLLHLAVGSPRHHRNG